MATSEAKNRRITLSVSHLCKKREGKTRVDTTPSETAAPNDNLPSADRTPYEELQQRIGQAATNEYWILKGAKRLEGVPQRTVRLANLSDKTLRVLLVRWTNLLEAAKEAAGTAPEKSA